MKLNVMSMGMGSFMEQTIIMEAFAFRLKELRKERKVKQSELAELLGITLRQYQRTEYGEVNVPSLTLCTLADYFGVTTDYLLGRSERRD